MINPERVTLALAFQRVRIYKREFDNVMALIDELVKIRNFKTSRNFKALFIRKSSGDFYSPSEQRVFIEKNSLKIDWFVLGKEDSDFDISIQSLLTYHNDNLEYAIGIKRYPFIFFPYNFVNGMESLFNLDTHQFYNVNTSDEFEDILLLPTSSQYNVDVYLDSLLKDAEDGKFRNSDAIIRKVTGLKKELEKL